MWTGTIVLQAWDGEEDHRFASARLSCCAIRPRYHLVSRRREQIYHHCPHLSYHIEHSIATDSSRHEHDGRVQSASKDPQRRGRRRTSAVTAASSAASAADLVQLYHAYHPAHHHLAHLRPAVWHLVHYLLRVLVDTVRCPRLSDHGRPAESLPGRRGGALFCLFLRFLRILAQRKAVSVRPTQTVLSTLRCCRRALSMTTDTHVNNVAAWPVSHCLDSHS